MANALEKAATMNAKDAVSGGLGSCFVVVSGRRYSFANLIKIEATVEKTKTEVPILGRTGKGHKSSGWEGTGSMTLHYNQDVFRKLVEQYKNAGVDFYFDTHVILNDPTTQVGGQYVILKDCNIDSLMIANLDADAEYLEEDVDFTFDDFSFSENFKDPKHDGGSIVHTLTEAGMSLNKLADSGFNLFGTVANGVSSITGAF